MSETEGGGHLWLLIGGGGGYVTNDAIVEGEGESGGGGLKLNETKNKRALLDSHYQKHLTPTALFQVNHFS